MKPVDYDKLKKWDEEVSNSKWFNIPCIFFDDLIGLSACEMRTYIFILLCTMGCQRESHQLAATFIAHGTGDSLRSVQRSLQLLEKQGLIHRIERHYETREPLEYRTNYKPLTNPIKAWGNRQIAGNSKKVMDYYEEVVGRLAMKGRGVNRKHSQHQINRLLRIHTVDELKASILNYRQSDSFKKDFIYSITNFFGQKEYWKSFKPVVIMNDEQRKTRAEQCNKQIKGHCQFELGVSSNEWCAACVRKKLEY